MTTSTIGQPGVTKLRDGVTQDLGLPPTRTVKKRLDRMSAILDGDTMRVHIGGEDRTGILLHVADMVYRRKLNIEEGLVGRLQRENTSTLLITGRRDRLEDLAKCLANDEEPLVGEVIVPDKIWDLTMRVYDRNGLIFDVCSVLKGYKVNVKSLTSFVSIDERGQDWACVKSRIEVGRDSGTDMLKLQEEIDRKLRGHYELHLIGTPGHFDFRGWIVSMTERRHEHDFGESWPTSLGGTSSMN